MVGDASAIILAGGRSSRMGSPKALLRFGDESLISHIVRTLKASFDDVVVVAAPQQELPVLPARLVRDEVPFQGPVGGIYYGLRSAAAEICFVSSCDAPFLNLPLIQWLLAALGDADIVVPMWENRLQPLHAVYRRAVAAELKRQLDEGSLRTTTVFDRVRTRIVTEDEVRARDPEGLSFINVNTPEDYQRALRRW